MKTAAKEVQQIDIVNDIPCTRVYWWLLVKARTFFAAWYCNSNLGRQCIDIETKSRYCYGCRMWEGKKETLEYQIWKLDHHCQINHTKSPGAMESAGAVDMFSRSVIKNNLIYKEYLGDGDTSSFNDVVESKPYADQNVVPVKVVAHQKISRFSKKNLLGVLRTLKPVKSEKILKKSKNT